MATSRLADPKQLMVEHYQVLRAYAERAAHRGEVLTATEEADKSGRLDEFFALGVTVGCTKEELTAVLYRGLFREVARCGCFNCKLRTPAQ